MTETSEGLISDIKALHWVIWTALLFSTLALYPSSVSSSWMSNSDVHGLLEFWAASVALTAGLIIMVHYFANGSWLFLVISLGFVLQGGEDLVHAIFSFSRIWGEEQKDLIKFVPGTYAAGRFLLVACTLFGWFLRNKYTDEAYRKNIALLVFVSGIALSLLSTFLAIKLHLLLPHFITPGRIITRPVDLLVGLIYLLVTILYINGYREIRHHTPFVFFIICSLIFGTAAQIYMVHSQGLYDGTFDMAHVIKIVSYLFPILGISFGTFRMYAKEAEHRKSLAHCVQKEKALSACAAAAAEAERMRAEELAAAMVQVHASQQQLNSAYEQLAASERELRITNHQLTVKEEALREAQKELELKYRLIVDTATEGIWMIGPDFMTTFVNVSMADMLGYRSEEMIGRPVTDFMFEEDTPDHLIRMENRRRGLSEHYERRYRHKNGQTVWTLASAVPIIDAGQNFKGSFAMFTDINERKRAEEDLHRLNAELEQRVKERTAELIAKNDVLKRMNHCFVGRELKMIELKKKLADLEKAADKRSGV